MEAELKPGAEAGSRDPSGPYYAPVGRELEIFRAAVARGLPIMLKGPTGCGKTRLVEHMAHQLEVPLFTVSCHEDMTASDLLGRFVLQGNDTVWVDGPLTRAVKEGGICYLDEIVEARQDATVAIHSLADHRRELNLERQGGTSMRAAEGFCLVVSYNPGYQSVLKDLKMSTRQRMISIELDFPPPELEREIIMNEAQVERGARRGPRPARPGNQEGQGGRPARGRLDPDPRRRRLADRRGPRLPRGDDRGRRRAAHRRRGAQPGARRDDRVLRRRPENGPPEV